MRRALVAALVAALHLAAASAPCPPPAAREGGAPAAAFASGALHPTHGAPDAQDGAERELRAPCPCGCGHAAAGGAASGRLGPVLLRAAPTLACPSATTPLARTPLAFARSLSRCTGSGPAHGLTRPNPGPVRPRIRPARRRARPPGDQPWMSPSRAPLRRARSRSLSLCSRPSSACSVCLAGDPLFSHPGRHRPGGGLLLAVPGGARIPQIERPLPSPRRSGRARGRRPRARRRGTRRACGASAAARSGPRAPPRPLRELDPARPLDADPRRARSRGTASSRSEGGRAPPRRSQRLRRRLARLERRALAQPRRAAEHLARGAALAEDADGPRRGGGRRRARPAPPAGHRLLGLRRRPRRGPPPLLGLPLRERLLPREHAGRARLHARRRLPRESRRRGAPSATPRRQPALELAHARASSSTSATRATTTPGGERYQDSGGSILYATPSVRVRLPWSFGERTPSLRAAVQLPLTQDLAARLPAGEGGLVRRPPGTLLGADGPRRSLRPPRARAPAPPRREQGAEPARVVGPDGAAVALAPAPGERALLAHFWASWCPECVRELPLLQRFGRAAPRAASASSTVNVGETPEQVERYRERARPRAPGAARPEGRRPGGGSRPAACRPTWSWSAAGAARRGRAARRGGVAARAARARLRRRRRRRARRRRARPASVAGSSPISVTESRSTPAADGRGPAAAAAGFAVRGEVIDLRKRGLVPVPHRVQLPGVIHRMALEAQRRRRRAARRRARGRASRSSPSSPRQQTRGESCRDPAGALQALVGRAPRQRVPAPPLRRLTAARAAAPIC